MNEYLPRPHSDGSHNNDISLKVKTQVHAYICMYVDDLNEIWIRSYDRILLRT
jgi:hypothetical protein